MRFDWRFKAAGFAGWLAIAAPALVDIRSGTLSGWMALAWATGFVTFGAAYALYLRPDTLQRVRARAVIAVLAAAGFTMVLTSVGLMKYLASVSLTIVAGELPFLYPPRVVWLWVAAQSALLAAIFWSSFGWVSGIAGGTAYAGFQIFALGRAWLEQRERAARQALARTNAELLATRTLLAESSRVAERVRIARDLHDSLGHHLTALSLQLDVASRKSGGPEAAHLQEAHAIARLLLSDVRHVVGELRERAEIDVAVAIRALATDAGSPRIHVEIPDALTIDSAEHAQALLRCAQEVVTNAMRHARAQNVWIRVTRIAHDDVELYARDDGAGAESPQAGHGLTGMRERFEAHGGRVEFSTAPGRGFAVRASLPSMERRR